ncbi:MAG: hypothetical protein R2744_06280 [Bacteroidales bacterium]
MPDGCDGSAMHIRSSLSSWPGQDVFKKKIADLLYYFKMLPVFRIRDGFSTLRQNDEIFNKTIDVILNRNSWLCCSEAIMQGSEGSGS